MSSRLMVYVLIVFNTLLLGVFGLLIWVSHLANLEANAKLEAGTVFGQEHYDHCEPRNYCKKE